MDDISTDGVDLIDQIRTIYDNYGYGTEILAASIRHPMHIIQCAEVGADVATCPLSAITALFDHPLTTIGLEKFLADHKKAAQAARRPDMLLTIHPRNPEPRKIRAVVESLRNGGVVVCPDGHGVRLRVLRTQCPGHRRGRAFERGEAAKGGPFTDLSRT